MFYKAKTQRNQNLFWPDSLNNGTKVGNKLEKGKKMETIFFKELLTKLQWILVLEEAKTHSSTRESKFHTRIKFHQSFIHKE